MGFSHNLVCKTVKKPMTSHIRANLWLLVLSLGTCSVLYPLVLWVYGQVFFPRQAEGSIVSGPDGKPVGSRLIAQPFTRDEYFQPRPSAASYNAAASGASNWAASNYKLRFRVAKALGPIVKYGAQSPQKGQPVGPDIEKWFREHPVKDGKGIVAQWAQAYPSAAQTWVGDDKANAAYVEQWARSHPDEVAQWKKDNPATPEPKPEDLAGVFFESYSRAFPGTFPSQVEQKTPDGKTQKVMQPVQSGADIQSYFFDMWRQEHPDVDLEKVPADMVMASGSGLDPHITLENARYQLDRVAGAWAEKTKADKGQVRKEIEAMLNQKAEAPLGGLVGVPLINVLEINLALHDRYGTRAVAAR